MAAGTGATGVGSAGVLGITAAVEAGGGACFWSFVEVSVEVTGAGGVGRLVLAQDRPTRGRGSDRVKARATQQHYDRKARPRRVSEHRRVASIAVPLQRFEEGALKAGIGSISGAGSTASRMRFVADSSRPRADAYCRIKLR